MENLTHPPTPSLTDSLAHPLTYPLYNPIWTLCNTGTRVSAQLYDNGGAQTANPWDIYS